MSFSLDIESAVYEKYSAAHKCAICKRSIPDVLFSAHTSCGICGTNVVRDEARGLGLVEMIMDNSCTDVYGIYENLFAVLDAKGIPHRHSIIHIANDILVLHLPKYVWDAIELTVGMAGNTDIDIIKIMESVLPDGGV